MKITNAFLQTAVLVVCAATASAETVLWEQAAETVAKPGKGAGGTVIELSPNWYELTLTGEFKVQQIPAMKQSWQNGRFAMEWRDEKGKTVSPWPNNIGESGTRDWHPVKSVNQIPIGAKKLILSLSNLSDGGEAWFRNVKLAVTGVVPDGFESLDGAFRTANGERVRYSLNGLWRTSHQAKGYAGKEQTGYGRVPEPWDGNHAFQRYERRFSVPAEAAGKRVFVAFDIIASRAVVSVDGKEAGAVRFPNGEVEITDLVKPGVEQLVSIAVSAETEGETLDYNEATRANRKKKEVMFKGITGDLWLDLVPKGPRIVDCWAETDLANRRLRLVAETEGIADGEVPAAAVLQPVKGGGLLPLKGKARAAGGRMVFEHAFPEGLKLWDIHTPELYTVTFAVSGARAIPFVTGFREVRIDGRDVRLNDKVFHFRTLYDGTFNSRMPDGLTASKPNALAFIRNLKAYGFNAFTCGCFSMPEGGFQYTEGMLSACDETGYAYAFTIPHFKDFGDLRKSEGEAEYRRVAKGIMKLARRHPSVLLYAASHNAAGYLGAGNPRRIDGIYELPATFNGVNRAKARIVSRIGAELDPTRPVMHYESGNLGAFHTVNCYLDWAPIQEKSDWLEHWSTEGVKPAFFVEWGMPHIASFSSYRGPLFIWGGIGYMSNWTQEYAAAFRGDAAYPGNETSDRALALEASWWAKGEPFAFWRIQPGCRMLEADYLGVQAMMMDDNLRSFRGWGMTGVVPWDHKGLHDCREDPPKTRPEDYYAKTPGWKADLVAQRGDPAYWSPTAPGRVYRRWNQDECAFIAGGGKDLEGKDIAFTDKRHVFAPGERIEKSLMIICDRREKTAVEWRVDAEGTSEHGDVTLEPGGIARVPFAFAAPAKPGDYVIRMTCAYGTDRKVFKDEFAFTVLGASAPVRDRLALYDPKGATAANLTRLGFAPEAVADPAAVPKGVTRLVIGREALTREVFESAVVPFAKNGGRVVVFEQAKAALEDIGFRVQRYGLRRVYPRYPKKGLGALMKEALLRDWAGESTLIDPYDPLSEVETQAGRDTFAGFTNTRVWRCRNRGAVATVIPEKPSVGDWCALVDGGFDLQYAPLLEWRLSKTGSVTFCQLDVTGRTVNDVAADELVKALVAVQAEALPPTFGGARPFGEHAYTISREGRSPWIIEHDLEKKPKALFLVTGGKPPDDFKDAIAAGGTALLLGLDAEGVRAWSPEKLAVEDVKGRYYRRIEAPPAELAGLSNADWAWHGAMDFAAFTDAAKDGNEAFRVIRYGKGRLVFWQVPPWKIDAEARPYLRGSKRRAEAMLSRLMGNLGFMRGPDRILYADVPQAEDDPYRYYHW